MPMSERGIGAIITSGITKDRNHPTIITYIIYQHCPERYTEVTEDLIRDLPFPVPFKGINVLRLRLYGGILLKFIPFWQTQLTYGISHAENRVDRAFRSARNISRNIYNPLKILPVYSLIFGYFSYIYKL